MPQKKKRIIGLSSVAFTTGNKSVKAMYKNIPAVNESEMARMLLCKETISIRNKAAVAPIMVDKPNKTAAPIAFFLLFSL